MTFVADSNSTDPYADFVAFCADTSSGECLLASQASNFQALYDNADVHWLLYAGSLVFIMQLGFATLCAGCCRTKNVKNILLYNLLDTCGTAFGYWMIGYAIAFGPGKFIGLNLDYFCLKGVSDGYTYIFWFYQMNFAAATASIVAGAIAERTKVQAYLLYSFFLSSLIYPIIEHSVWNIDGFFSPFREDRYRGTGVVDFAGSGVVHLTGGVASLVGIYILGPRKGRFYDEDGKPLPEAVTWPPHSVSLQMIGTLILWFGWYGFNPGSTLKITPAGYGDIAALACVNTTLSASLGAIFGMFFDTFLGYIKTRQINWDVGCCMNGALCALASITGGCAVVDTWAAVVIGIVAGCIYVLASKLLIKLRLDDVVDAVPVHFFGGIWGLLSTGLFAEPLRISRAYLIFDHQGWFYSWGKQSGDANLLLNQFFFMLWVIGFAGVTMGLWFLALRVLGLLRVNEADEDVGLDISVHKGSAYN